ncbi:MAG: CPBP family intramembrane glutamic endopeptidase [Balneolaceae bacterium]|nr:CPBP family intramembrane glutamic endopeptidase [Balneolaceae bacterium]
MQEERSTAPFEGDLSIPPRPWVERNGFAHWAIALIWIVVAFFAFQFFAAIVSVVLILSQGGLEGDPAQVMEAFSDQLDLVFIGNSSGQILFLGFATWVFSRLHTVKGKHRSFMRFHSQKNTPYMIGLTALLIIAAQPGIWFLSWLNAMIPIPEALSQFQDMQMQMIEDYLKGDHLLALTLFHVGVVPAICEEVLYRSYTLRAFEKSWGIWPAIIVSGFLFGAYHLQLANLLPLASIGILLAYITWTSNSIYPAIIAHFINNGGSVLVGTYYPESAFAELTPESMPPLEAVIISLIVSGYLVYLMYKQYQKSQTEGAKADV